jgi:hypothetical protein
MEFVRETRDVLANWIGPQFDELVFVAIARGRIRRAVCAPFLVCLGFRRTRQL